MPLAFTNLPHPATLQNPREPCFLHTPRMSTKKVHPNTLQIRWCFESDRVVDSFFAATAFVAPPPRFFCFLTLAFSSFLRVWLMPRVEAASCMVDLEACVDGFANPVTLLPLSPLLSPSLQLLLQEEGTVERYSGADRLLGAICLRLRLRPEVDGSKSRERKGKNKKKGKQCGWGGQQKQV